MTSNMQIALEYEYYIFAHQGNLCLSILRNCHHLLVYESDTTAEIERRNQHISMANSVLLKHRSFTRKCSVCTFDHISD